MNKPIIGIVTKHYIKNQIRPDMYIRDEVKQAVFDNNAIAIGITLPINEKLDVDDNWQNNFTDKEYEDLIAQINLCDGIIFQGGGACDNYEMIVAKYCYDNDIPTLGLCCGQNVMVRALNGTTENVKNQEKHFNIKKKYVHKTVIKKQSKLYKIIGSYEIMVNSRHKKTVRTYPKLLASAIDEDGNVDAVESSDKNFYMAFRFHPESLYKEDINMNNIFKYFIKKCKENK